MGRNLTVLEEGSAFSKKVDNDEGFKTVSVPALLLRCAVLSTF